MWEFCCESREGGDALIAHVKVHAQEAQSVKRSHALAGLGTSLSRRASRC